MENCILDHSALLQMLDHNSFEQLRSHPSVPDALGIYDEDRPSPADTQAGCLTTLDPGRAEQEALPLKERRQQRVQRPATPVWRAEAPGAEQEMSCVRFHERQIDARHAGHWLCAFVAVKFHRRKMPDMARG